MTGTEPGLTETKPGRRAPAIRGRWRPPREVPVGLGLIAAGAVIAGVIPDFRAQEWALWLIYGLLALSFTFVWGHTGVFSFGQAAFFGVGGYAYGVAGIDLSLSTGESVSALVIAVLVTMLLALILGYFIFYGNVGDVYVAIITLAVSLVMLTFMSSTASPKYHIGSALLGGYNGMVGVPPMMLHGSSMLGSNALFLLCVVLAVVVAMAVRILLRRPFGRVIAGVRENERRTQLLGYDVRRYKLIAFVLGGGMAGLAGGLYAAWGTFINPSVFELQQAALVAIWVLVGGRSSIAGAFVGVAIVQGLSSALGSGGGDWTPIVLGVALILVVLLLPDGLVPTLQGLARRFVPWPRPRPATLPVPESADDRTDAAEALSPVRGAGLEPRPLAVTDLAKSFGGVSALRGITLEFPATTVQCLIGPNGAGKSTCFNLLAGIYAPSAGEVTFGESVITKLPPHERVRLGIGIKPQVPSHYGPLTVFENVWLAAYARSRDVERANARAVAILGWLGLLPKAMSAADALSHGEHQWLDIGMVLAGEPVVMLLDEPTAGMTPEETMRTVDLIQAMGEHATVIVVEHDMGFVRALDAPVTVFHEGAVFARGSIEELRTDERVLDIYLGRSSTTDASR
jgi:branched-chain amino acid transport system permease protein